MGLLGGTSFKLEYCFFMNKLGTIVYNIKDISDLRTNRQNNQE